MRKPEEIIFRGRWQPGEWAFGLLSHSIGEIGQPPEGWYISNEAGMPWAYCVDPETIGQFVGIYCSGQRAYDGDIVKIHLEEWLQNSDPETGMSHGRELAEKTLIGEVRMRICGGAGMIVRKVLCEDEDIGPRHELHGRFMRIKTRDYILGNKWDNPELLQYPPDPELTMKEKDIPW